MTLLSKLKGQWSLYAAGEKKLEFLAHLYHGMAQQTVGFFPLLSFFKS